MKVSQISDLTLHLLVSLLVEFSLFSFNNGMVVSSCRELDNNRSALSAASAFAIATAGANEGTPTKEKYRRMSLASTGQSCFSWPSLKLNEDFIYIFYDLLFRCHVMKSYIKKSNETQSGSNLLRFSTHWWKCDILGEINI